MNLQRRNPCNAPRIVSAVFSSKPNTIFHLKIKILEENRLQVQSMIACVLRHLDLLHSSAMNQDQERMLRVERCVRLHRYQGRLMLMFNLVCRYIRDCWINPKLVNIYNSQHQWLGRTDGYLQMNRLSLRNNRLKFKTSGGLPITFKEFMEYTPN